MNLTDAINKLPQREDREFIYDQLNRFNPSDHSKIFKGYIDQWRVGKESEPVEQKKTNAGRRMANLWLLKL